MILNLIPVGPQGARRNGGYFRYSYPSNRSAIVGELEQYEDSYRLCYVRGPDGIIVALAEQLS